MRTTLNTDHIAMLAAVEQKRVHHDPRYIRPDYERVPTGLRRAGRRLGPLKAARLVRLADDADQYGVRLYELTDHGTEVLDAARALQAAAAADQTETTRPAADE